MSDDEYIFFNDPFDLIPPPIEVINIEEDPRHQLTEKKETSRKKKKKRTISQIILPVTGDTPGIVDPERESLINLNVEINQYHQHFEEKKKIFNDNFNFVKDLILQNIVMNKIKKGTYDFRPKFKLMTKTLEDLFNDQNLKTPPSTTQTPLNDPANILRVKLEFYKKEIKNLNKSLTEIQLLRKKLTDENKNIRRSLNIPPKGQATYPEGFVSFENQIAFLMAYLDGYLNVKEIVKKLGKEWPYLNNINEEKIIKSIQMIIDQNKQKPKNSRPLHGVISIIHKKGLKDLDNTHYRWSAGKFTMFREKVPGVRHINRVKRESLYYNGDHPTLGVIILLIFEVNKDTFLNVEQIFNEVKYLRTVFPLKTSLRFVKEKLEYLWDDGYIIKNRDSRDNVTYLYHPKNLTIISQIKKTIPDFKLEYTSINIKNQTSYKKQRQSELEDLKKQIQLRKEKIEKILKNQEKTLEIIEKKRNEQNQIYTNLTKKQALQQLQRLRQIQAQTQPQTQTQRLRQTQTQTQPQTQPTQPKVQPTKQPWRPQPKVQPTQQPWRPQPKAQPTKQPWRPQLNPQPLRQFTRLPPTIQFSNIQQQQRLFPTQPIINFTTFNPNEVVNPFLNTPLIKYIPTGTDPLTALYVWNAVHMLGNITFEELCDRLRDSMRYSKKMWLDSLLKDDVKLILEILKSQGRVEDVKIKNLVYWLPVNHPPPAPYPIPSKVLNEDLAIIETPFSTLEVWSILNTIGQMNIEQLSFYLKKNHNISNRNWITYDHNDSLKSILFSLERKSRVGSYPTVSTFDLSTHIFFALPWDRSMKKNQFVNIAKPIPITPFTESDILQIISTSKSISTTALLNQINVTYSTRLQNWSRNQILAKLNIMLKKLIYSSQIRISDDNNYEIRQPLK